MMKRDRTEPAELMRNKITILFVCHGSICRSPMAEYIMKDLVHKAGLEDHFRISSAAATYEETGNDIYPPAKRILKKRGIPFERHYAHHITAAEEKDADCIIGMDSENMYDLRRLFPHSTKLSLLLDYTDHPRDVADPWYTDDYETAFRDILEGCEALLAHLTQ